MGYNRAMLDAGERRDADGITGPRRALAAWLAGPIAIDAALAMAERVAWEVSEPDGRPPTLVLFELEPSITVGRAGSRTDVDFTDDELRAHRLPLTFIGRGGGAILHGPGQVCVSLFATLTDLGLGRHDAGGYLERFEHALEAAVRTVRCGAARDSSLPGIFGRTGLLAAVGVAVRRGVVWHGGFLNVCPALSLHHRVRSLPVAPKTGMRTMSSIEADVQRPVRVQDVRSALVQQMVDAFAFPRVHVQAGFPVPVGGMPRAREVIKRVG